jgi:lipopolysaccharide transport system ATP-binding protein
MSTLLINADNVGKKFCRDLKRSLRYGMQDLGAELIGRRRGHDQLRKDEFWALQGVSFTLSRGETLGLIGHNGAGKTTMLRILNGLIKPDVGNLEVRGRMQALIALGAGFNPILTGRENLYVNASILGFSKDEIERRFDEIVAFSGIEEFIDMPVRSYSSGMVVRLGFSIAANLEPDILLVDEVLSVGDLAFRTKSQLRIQELKNAGVAIILVSHNLHTISHVCTRAITLEKGQIIYDGDTEKAIDAYRTSLMNSNKNIEDELRAGTGELRLEKVEVLDLSENPKQEFEIGESLKIRMHYHAKTVVDDPVFNVALHILNGQQISGLRTDTDGIKFGGLFGNGYVDILVPNINLLPNIYTIDGIAFHKDGFTFYDRINKVAHIKIRGGMDVNGIVYIPHRWDITPTNQNDHTPSQIESN